jgi:uncharacterized lipoprotein YbaY
MQKVIKPLMVLAGVALTVACANPSASTGNGFVPSTSKAAQPVATSGPADAPGAPHGAATTREITLPAGTLLPVTLEDSVGSDISRVDQPVHGRLRRAVILHGVEVLPAGTAVNGHVTAAQRPGRVKGRGYVAMRFTEVDPPGAGSEHISSAAVSRLAPTTRQKDAVEILAPAAAGAVIGRLAGGKSGAATGAVVGGAGGTGYVLATRGKDVRIGKGAPITVRLTRPVTVSVRG